jgi:hypothetical protein
MIQTTADIGPVVAMTHTSLMKGLNFRRVSVWLEFVRLQDHDIFRPVEDHQVAVTVKEAGIAGMEPPPSARPFLPDPSTLKDGGAPARISPSELTWISVSDGFPNGIEFDVVSSGGPDPAISVCP